MKRGILAALLGLTIPIAGIAAERTVLLEEFSNGW